MKIRHFSNNVIGSISPTHTNGPFSGPFTTDLDIGTVTNSDRQSERKKKKGKSWHMSKVHRFGTQLGWQKHN